MRGAAVAACVALAARTHARNADWRDEYHLWRAAVEVSPGAARAHNNLGNALMQMRRLPEATAEFETALRILPTYADARYSLGVALEKSPGRLSEAIAEFETTLREEPGYLNAHIELGLTLAQMPGRLAEATAELRTAIRLRPDSARAHDCPGRAAGERRRAHAGGDGRVSGGVAGGPRLCHGA
jgi:tetratricopeptide (TPR) repeat protein